jgi:hypothetical protein
LSRQIEGEPIGIEKEKNIRDAIKFEIAFDGAVAKLKKATINSVIAINEPLLGRMKDKTTNSERPQESNGSS